MKLVLAIVRDDCAGDVVSSLSEARFGVTRVSSTGGFWRRGNVSLLVGVDDDQVDKALQIIDQHAGPCIEPELAKSAYAPHRATVFVINVDSFAHY